MNDFIIQLTTKGERTTGRVMKATSDSDGRVESRAFLSRSGAWLPIAGPTAEYPDDTELDINAVHYCDEPPPEPPQEAPMKCLECGGKGFIEHNYGLVQAQCTACHGIGTLPDADLTLFGSPPLGPLPDMTAFGEEPDAPVEETEHADIDRGVEQPDKTARKPYARKSTKPRKRPKGR